MILDSALSLLEEMASYETIWGMKNATQKSVSEIFHKYSLRPSKTLRELMKEEMYLDSLYREVLEYVDQLTGFSVSVYGAFQYPERLRAAVYPLELFYYKGFIGLTETRCVSVVGARKASPEGVKRASRLARELVAEDFTIVSGLAEGIDTSAMQSAIKEKGRTIGVIGTPINEYYPKKNKELQDQVARNFLLVSQVPFYRYSKQTYHTNRFFFPQRNETMAALSEATIIVEASDTSGSLTQARAALQQGRKLFILNSCFENKAITWPSYYEERGAIRVKTTDDILSNLQPSNEQSNVEEL